LGAYLARELFDIDDPEILDAIAWHTTGRKNMTLLEKIICLADFIEEGRSYNGVEDIRKLAFVDINRALLAGFDLSIKNIVDKGKLLHPMTIEARNSLLLEIKDEEDVKLA
jgi:predicted HD superfamily hydrolase involved in NAD metabolism